MLFERSGLRLSPAQYDRFWRFHQLLRRRQDELDLTRLHNFDNMVLKLYVDSALVATLVDLPSPLLDLGSGGGFPGIPLKIVRPDIRLLLAEARAKRAGFLKEAIHVLDLRDVEVVAHRIGRRFEPHVAGIITRAVESIPDSLARVAAWLEPGARVLFMKGPGSQAEVESARSGFADTFRITLDRSYRIPATPHERRLVVLQRLDAPYESELVPAARAAARAIDAALAYRDEWAEPPDEHQRDDAHPTPASKSGPEPEVEEAAAVTRDLGKQVEPQELQELKELEELKELQELEPLEGLENQGRLDKKEEPENADEADEEHDEWLEQAGFQVEHAQVPKPEAARSPMTRATPALRFGRHQPHDITSESNPTFREFLALHKGRGIRKYSRALIAGMRSILEILRDFPERCVAWISAASPPPPPEAPPTLLWYRLGPGLFQRVDVFGTGPPLLLIRVPDLPAWVDQDWPPGCTLFVPFQDPENVGALLRSAAAFGASCCVLLEEAASPFHPRSVRASGGSMLRVPLLRGPSIRKLRVVGAPLLALSTQGRDIGDLTFPPAFGLLPGLEGPGLPESLRTEATLRIPMAPGVESLNAATAVAVALYLWRRQAGPVAGTLPHGTGPGNGASDR